MTTQPEPTLIEFADYNQWANQQLLKRCMNIDDNLLKETIQGTFGSIRATFGHILRAEAGFLERIQGTSPQPSFNWETDPSLEAMAAFAAQLGAVFLDTIKKTAPTDNVHEENDDWTFDYHARLIFMSLVYHGISHRTDITTFLSSQGFEVPELDIWAYQEAYPERFDAQLKKKENGQ